MLFQAEVVDGCSELDADPVAAPAQLANRVHRMSESAGEWSRVWRLPTRRRESGRVGSAGTGPSVHLPAFRV